MERLKTVNLCKTYEHGKHPVHALVNASIQIKAGEFVAIVGTAAKAPYCTYWEV